MVWHSWCAGTFLSHVTSLGTLEDKTPPHWEVFEHVA